MLVVLKLVAFVPHFSPAQTTLVTPTFQKLNTYLDTIPAIDTHVHLWPFDKLPGCVETAKGEGMSPR